MCPDRKQILAAALKIVAASFIFAGPAQAGQGQGEQALARPGLRSDGAAGSAGGVAVGEGAGGITDHAYVTAPPSYLYVVERARGDFLDCGEGRDVRATDEDGRDRAHLRCGVTLTETIIIPAAAASARIIIHY